MIGVQPGTPRENIAEAAGKARERRAENDRLKQIEAEMFEELGGRSEAVPGLRPGGRAPRGQGSEYAARNWVADRIEYFEDQLAAINERASRSRGTRRDRAAQSVNSGRKAAITESLGMATSLAAGFLEGGGSFASEKSFFQEIFALPMALTGG